MSRLTSKDTATELAMLLSSQSVDKSKVAALAADLHASTKSVYPPRTNASKKTNEESIGIWQLQDRHHEQIYVRDEKRKSEWYAWANVHEIVKKSKGKRIALIGESVARGLFYDPYYNPAQALETYLNACGLKFEILDLARVGIDLDALKNLNKSCESLNPDLIICFAGNNWLLNIFESFSQADLSVVAGILTGAEKSKTLKDVIEDKIDESVTKFVDEIHTNSLQTNTPIIFVIPDFNHTGWKSTDAERVVPWIENGGTLNWIKSREIADASKREINPDIAEAAARHMIELDKGTHPLPFEILAECFLRKDLFEDAKALLEKAKDTAMYGRQHSKPRMLSRTRTTLIEKLQKKNIQYIDVKALLDILLTEEEPHADRFFLDYCHMSSEGIDATMKNVATLVAEVVTGKTTPSTTLKDIHARPSNDIEATAIFFAAIHNCHCGQPYETLHKYCLNALSYSPLVAELMTHYIDFTTRKSPNVLCKSHEEFVKHPGIRQFEDGLGIFHGRNTKSSDFLLVDAMVDALKAHGIDKTEEVNTLRKKQHSSQHGTVNLLELYYQERQTETTVLAEKAYYQAADITSKFIIFENQGTPLTSTITLRLPRGAYNNKTATIKFNGSPITQIESSHTWTTQTVSIPADLVRDGLNRLEVAWPVPYSLSTDDLPLLEKIYPMYGHIFAFTLNAL